MQLERERPMRYGRCVYRQSRVFDIMRERGIFQSWLARECGCSEAAISRMRSGSRGFPTWFVVRCVTLFEMPHDELFSDPIPPPPYRHAPEQAAPRTIENPGWFWARTDRRNECGCWEWTGGLMPTGYGYTRLTGDPGGFSRYAHRTAYEIANGPIPDGMFVLHTCDNRPCVNPAHLFVGTHQDNMRDRDSKGRQARGSSSPNARLSEADIPIIRSKFQHDTIQSIANQFGVTYSTILSIRDGRTWKHVPVDSEASNAAA